MFTQAWFWLLFASMSFANSRSAFESETQGQVSGHSGDIMLAHVCYCVYACFISTRWWHGPAAFIIGLLGSVLVNTVITAISPKLELFFMAVGKYLSVILLALAVIVTLL